MTVFILCCDDRFAVEKRPDKGLLAGLWQFPNTNGKLETSDALKTLEDMGLHPAELHRQVERDHIFTHITWKMRGYYLSVKEQNNTYTWLTLEQIRQQAALPTAFRQFWEELDNV